PVSTPYTIDPGSGGGGGALLMANRGNVATLQVKQGQHTLNAPVIFADPGRIDVAAGSQLTATAGVTVSGGRTLTKTGAGLATLTGGLTLGNGAVADASAGEWRIDQING